MNNICYIVIMEEKVLSFLKSVPHGLCVFSTSSPDGKPESAVVTFAPQDDLSIIISTKTSSRKATNIRQNRKVALVAGWEFTGLNVQYEGMAQVIEVDSPDYQTYEEAYYAQREETRKLHSPDSVYIVVKPTWIRVLDLTQHPWKAEEKIFTEDTA
jgi:general stress protein 26